MKLTKNFTLEEFLISQTAARNGISMDPPVNVEDNLRRLCVDVLQPLRDNLGRPIVVSSGYRPPKLNQLIGGSPTSAHMSGRAADISVPGMSPLKVAQKIVELDLPYDQVIHEFGKWVHVGISKEIYDPRFEELTASSQNGRTYYMPGLRNV